jgi:hypothetical protein
MSTSLRSIMFVALPAFFLACSSNSSSTASNRGKLGTCYGQTGQTCTGVDTYENCLIAACGTQFNTCFGSDFSGGTCAAFLKCEGGCNCGDSSCFAGCVGSASSDCKSCLIAAGTCEQGAHCTMPSCGGTPDGPPITGGTPDAPPTSGGTPDAAASGGPDAAPSSGGPDAAEATGSCASLAACCATLPAGQLQNSCNVVANGGMDNLCKSSLYDFQQLGYCK